MTPTAYMTVGVVGLVVSVVDRVRHWPVPSRGSSDHGTNDDILISD